MSTKQNKAQRIAELERKLTDALAGQIHTYHFADAAIRKASVDRMVASGVVITITALGGQEIVQPTLIRDGLSNQTIEAIRADLRRSYTIAAQLKPAGV